MQSWTMDNQYTVRDKNKTGDTRPYRTNIVSRPRGATSEQHFESEDEQQNPRSKPPEDIIHAKLPEPKRRHRQNDHGEGLNAHT